MGVVNMIKVLLEKQDIAGILAPSPDCSSLLILRLKYLWIKKSANSILTFLAGSCYPGPKAKEEAIYDHQLL